MGKTQDPINHILLCDVFRVIAEGLAKPSDAGARRTNRRARDGVEPTLAALERAATALPMSGATAAPARDGRSRQTADESETYLARARDVFELEERTLRLERRGGNGYY